MKFGSDLASTFSLPIALSSWEWPVCGSIYYLYKSQLSLSTIPGHFVKSENKPRMVWDPRSHLLNFLSLCLAIALSLGWHPVLASIDNTSQSQPTPSVFFGATRKISFEAYTPRMLQAVHWHFVPIFHHHCALLFTTPCSYYHLTTLAVSALSNPFRQRNLTTVKVVSNIFKRSPSGQWLYTRSSIFKPNFSFIRVFFRAQTLGALL